MTKSAGLQIVLSEENRKLTAYHEGGHAIVALNTAGAHPIHKATIMPRGNALGMVTQVPSSVRIHSQCSRNVATLCVFFV